MYTHRAMAAIADQPEATETVTDRVCRLLRGAILRGELPPGMWLRQRPVARWLEVSPMPVVEAFRRFQSAGLLENVPHWGVRVRALNVDELEQLKLMRAAIEGQIARRLAERCQDLGDAVERLRPEAAEVDRLVALDPLDPARHELADRDLALHRRLGELSGMTLILQQIDGLALIERVVSVGRAEIDRVGRIGGQPVTHVQLIDAIASGDPDRAEQAARLAAGPTPDLLTHLRGVYGDGPIIPQRPDTDDTQTNPSACDHLARSPRTPFLTQEKSK